MRQACSLHHRPSRTAKEARQCYFQGQRRTPMPPQNCFPQEQYPLAMAIGWPVNGPVPTRVPGSITIRPPGTSSARRMARFLIPPMLLAFCSAGCPDSRQCQWNGYHSVAAPFVLDALSNGGSKHGGGKPRHYSMTPAAARSCIVVAGLAPAMIT